MTDTTQDAFQAFYPSDYRKLARVIKGVRKDSPDRADQLVSAAVSVFAADSPAFDAGRFQKATVEVPAYYGQLAGFLRQARYVQCQPYSPASDEKLAGVDAMQNVLAGVLSVEPEFDPELFAASGGLREGDRRGDVDLDLDDDEDDDEDDDSADELPSL